MTTSEPVQAVYLHVPFCRRLCGYCDFYSIVPEKNVIAPLVGALLRELDACSRAARIDVKTAFVGGGTPTLLPPDELHRLLSAVGKLAGARGVEEFSIEANPATVTADIADVLTASGVNRISIGAQTFQADELTTLERIHGPREIVDTVELCRERGLEQINLDLIFAIPGQSLQSWKESLRAACALEPDHLSCYSLTYEPGTRFYDLLKAGKLTRVDQDLDADMYEAAVDILTGAGFEHYEISNFARPGRRCRHNLVYWHNQPYCGVGPAAAGFVNGVRYKNVADLNRYIDAIDADSNARVEDERRTPEQRARETAMLELRLIEGLDRGCFARRFGQDPIAFFDHAVKRNVENGLLTVTDNHIRLTRKGLLLADRVIADFL